MNKKFFLIAGIIIFIATIQATGFSVTLIEQAKQYREKGYEAQQAGNIEEAITYYQKAASLDSKYASPHNDLGIIYETKGWLDRAEEEYKMALSIDPNYAKAHTNLALLYERKGETEKAAFHWMKRYNLGNPEDIWTQEAKARCERLGLIGKEAQRIERPSARVTRPAEVEPPERIEKEEPVTSEWARIGGQSQRISEEEIGQPTEKKTSSEDIRKRQLEASLKVAEERLREEKRKVQTTTDKSSRKYYNDAQNFYKNGEYVRALDSLKKARELSPDDRSIYELEDEIKNKMKQERISDHYNEGMRYFQQGNFKKAKEEFEAILSILPE